ncbi:MAG: peptidylprolyl isomerase [Chloroflexota bacterium]|nr:peptidylprolyl isomerase [Chloroflexota bacterium]
MTGYPLPTPTPGPTVTPNATATANARATGTAAAGSPGEATPTVVQTPTAASTPAATSPPTATVGTATTATGTTEAPSPTATPSGPTPTPAPTATPLPFPTYLARYQEVLGSESALIRVVAKARVLRQKLNEALGEMPTAQEQVRARHILVADEATAQTVVERLEAGEDFAALATELSTDNSTKEAGGDLGFFPRGVMVPEFEATAFSLAVGATSPPIETQFGHHIIRVEEREAQREIPDYQLQQIKANAINRWLDEQLTTAQIERRLDDRLIEWAERQGAQ